LKRHEKPLFGDCPSVTILSECHFRAGPIIGSDKVTIFVSS